MTKKQDKPKKPLNCYFRFVRDKGEEIKKEHEGKSHKDLQKIYSDEYNKLSDKEKQKYQKEYDEEKKEYDQEKKEYD